MAERSIVDAAARLRRHGEPHLVATVVSAPEPSYRRPGARMLLTQFRWIAGSASGGCLEGDIAHDSWRRTHTGEAVVVRYDARASRGSETSDDVVRAAFGLGGEGVVDVMLERAGVPGRIDPLELAHDCARSQQRAAVVTVFRSDAPDVPIGARVALRSGGEIYGDPIDDRVRAAMTDDARAAIERGESFTRSYAISGGAIDAFVEALLPPPRLFVLGAGHDALPVVELARAVGWDVTVCTPKPRVSVRERFVHADEVLVGTPAELAARVDECDRAAAVVMTHDHELDRQYLGMLMATRACYIGVLGSRVTPNEDPRIRTPADVEHGPESPAEIALAMIAEIQAATRAERATLGCSRPVARSRSAS